MTCFFCRHFVDCDHTDNTCEKLLTLFNVEEQLEPTLTTIEQFLKENGK